MLTLALFLALVAPAVSCDDTPHPGQDATTVDFFLPGQFDQMRREAKRTGRCFMIKGVAGGMDREGATCATKGHW